MLTTETVIKIVLLAILLVFFTKYLIFVLPKINLLDIPNSEKHKKHDKKIPLAGGIVLIIGVLISKVLFSSNLIFLNNYFISSLIILFIFGLWDDVKNLRYKYKFLGQLIAASLLIYGGFRVDIFGVFLVDSFITLIWYVGIFNAFNFLDGGDGLAIGVSTIILINLTVLGFLISKQFDLVLIGVILTIILLILYFYNKRPAKLYLGDSGSHLLGLFLSVFVLYFAPLGFYKETSWITPIMIFIFPIFDVTLVTFSRLGRNISPFEGGLDHSYHRLKRMTGSHSKSLLLIFAIVLVSNLIAAIALISEPLISILIAGGGFVIFVTAFIKLESFLASEKHLSIGEKLQDG